MSQSPHHASAVPLELGKYRLIIELAQGGMGFVYLAVAQGPAGFNKLAVIKELKPSLLEEPGFLEMFLDEARLSARLSHPNVVQTNEVSVENGRAFLAMEYLDGQSLNRVRSRLGKSRTLPLAADVRIVAQACAGLHYAHELRDFDGTPLGVVHRDVSPHNIFVTYDGQVKIVDFGVAKALSSNHESTIGVLKGKVPYMAPEQVMGAAMDRRSDIFALGVILWEAVAGRRIWDGLRPETILARMMSSDVPQLAQAAPNADPRLVAIVERAMAWAPDNRYPTAEALQADLEGWLATSEGGDYRAVAGVGAEMMRAFEKERAQVSASVSDQLRRLGSGQIGAPSVGLVRLPFAATGSHASMSPSTASALVGQSGTGAMLSPVVMHGERSPASGSGSGAGSGSHSGLTPSVAERIVDYSSNATVSMAVATSRPPLLASPAPPSRSGKGAAVAIAAVVTAALGLGLVVFLGRTRTPSAAIAPDASVATATPGAQTEATPVGPAAGSEVAPPTIDLTLRVSPSNARVYVDGAALPKSAQGATFKRDLVTHRIRAEAPGYVTKTELVTFEQSAEVTLQLDRVGAPALPAQPARPVRPVAPTVPPEKPEVPAKPGRPARPIDTDLDPK